MAEVGGNLESLVLHRERLSVSQRGVLARLRKLGLELEDCNGQEMLCSQPPAGPRGVWYLTNGRGWGHACEACLLAFVGGDQGILLDLRTVLLSRTKTPGRHRHGGGTVPTLLVFVEAWLKGLLGWRVGEGEREGWGLLERNWCEAQTLKEVRKGIRREREETKGGRGRGRSGGAPEPEFELELEPEVEAEVYRSRVTEVGEVPDLDAAVVAADGGGRSGRDGSLHSDSELDSDSAPDIEIEIIEHYAATVSTLHLPSLAVGSGSETTTAVGTQRSGLSGTTHAYDVAANQANCQGHGYGHRERSAEEQARSYQNLLAAPSSSSTAEGRRGWDGDSVSEGEATSRAGRKWWGRIGECDCSLGGFGTLKGRGRLTH